VKAWKTVLLIVLVTIVAGVAYTRNILRRGFSVHQPPSAIESTLARALRHYSIPEVDRREVNPWNNRATPEVLAEAMAHWADHCATCHANDGSGQTTIGQNLYPKAPDMRLPATQNMTDGELYYIIQNGLRMTGMPGWGRPGDMQNDASWQLVLFIRRLPHLTPEELERMKAMNPKSMLHAPAPIVPGEAPGQSGAQPGGHSATPHTH
jgi:mono/diheme cytochrome c family protein